jgi:hypothetical protein
LDLQEYVWGELPEPLANLSRAEDFARKVLPKWDTWLGKNLLGKKLL